MTWGESFILGIFQGLTEFLPVSSSGHLVLVQNLIGLKSHSLAFNIAAHLGTLCSIFVIYRKIIGLVILKLCSYPKTKEYSPEVHLALMVIVASVPTAIIGLGFKDLFETLFSDLNAIAICFLITGAILLSTRFKKNHHKSIQNFTDFSQVKLTELTFSKALLVGVAQSFAIAPGISRSGSTIATGLLLGLPRSTAALFSFMISIPAIMGAGLLELRNLELSEKILAPLIMGFGVSFFAGLIGLWLILKFVRNGRLELFTAYLWPLGIWLLFIK